MNSQRADCERLHIVVARKGYPTQSEDVFALSDEKYGTALKYDRFRVSYMRGEVPVFTLPPSSGAEIRRTFELDVGGPDAGVKKPSVSAELALIGQAFSPQMIYDVLEPLKATLSLQKRPLWLLAAGMGSELRALKELGVRPSVIYCAEIRHDAVEVLQNTAKVVFPGTPVVTTGDLRSKAATRFWSETAIWRRIDNEGVPIIISGWPCDGDSPQNARSVTGEGMSHPATATLANIGRIRRRVIAYLGTPRLESMKSGMSHRVRAWSP